MFNDKTAVVLGATSGIGEATAREFATAGARVVVAGRRVERGEAVASAIREAGGDASFIRCDAAEEQSIIDLMTAAAERYGRIEFAVNTPAKEIPSGLLADKTAADFDDAFRVAVRGIFLAMKYQIHHMLAHGGGSIVNVASTASHVAFPTAAIYTATKHAMLGLTKAAALEYIGQGIRINAVAPGSVGTEMLERFMVSAGLTLDDAGGSAPIGRAGRPEEIAKAIIWLSSPAASYVVGHSLIADGGATVA
jgi:NAD(P)-dependent dehydrogenase (short-subunit alcohol dehydrogenase family)